MTKCKICGKDTGFYDPNMKYCYDCFIKSKDNLVKHHPNSATAHVDKIIKQLQKKRIGIGW